MIPERDPDELDSGGPDEPESGPERLATGIAGPAPVGEVGAQAPPADAREQAASVWLTRQISQLRAEQEALREQLARVETELEQRSRRLHQLQGERDQLASLLAGRDAEVLRLARELGARERPPPRPSGWAEARKGLGRTAAAARRWLAGAATAVRPRRPPPAPTGETGLPEPLLVPWAKDGPPRPVLAAVLIGLGAAEIEGVLEVVERTCREQGSVPLLITDNDSFQLLRGRGAVIEFLPPRAEQQRAAPDLDWQLYTQRRLALIRRKWQPTRIVAFGPEATALVQLWQDSPFEDTPLPAAIRRRPEAGEPAGSI